MQNSSIIHNIGTLPDGIFPNDDTHKVHLYYRPDGNLYIFDIRLGQEVNLFELYKLIKNE